METNKALGPVGAELLLRLSAAGKTIFSIADAQAITNSTYKAMNVLLGQLVRKRWLVRLVPGKYLIVPLEAGLEVIPWLRYSLLHPSCILLASFLHPSYILPKPTYTPHR